MEGQPTTTLLVRLEQLDLKILLNSFGIFHEAAGIIKLAKCPNHVYHLGFTHAW